MICELVEAHAVKYGMEMALNDNGPSRAELMKSFDASLTGVGWPKALIATPHIKLDASSVVAIVELGMSPQVECLS